MTWQEANRAASWRAIALGVALGLLGGSLLPSDWDWSFWNLTSMAFLAAAMVVLLTVLVRMLRTVARRRG